MGKRIKRASDPQKVREGFLDFLKKAVPVFQRKLLDAPWGEVSAIAERSRAESVGFGANRSVGGRSGFFTVDKSKPVEPQLAAIAKRIAAMSFSPRGVTVFGLHWSAVHPGDTSLLRAERATESETTAVMARRPSFWRRLLGLARRLAAALLRRRRS